MSLGRRALEHEGEEAAESILYFFGVGNQCRRVFLKILHLGCRICMVLPVFGRYVDKPYPRTHKYVHMLDMWLHGRDDLDTRGAGSDDGNAVQFPLVGAVIIRPSSCMHDPALKRVQTFDIGQLEVVQQASAVQEHSAKILKVASRTVGQRLPNLDEPFPSVLLPITADNSVIEVHVLPKVENIADLFQVGPDVGARRVKSRPVGLQTMCKMRMILFILTFLLALTTEFQ